MASAATAKPMPFKPQARRSRGWLARITADVTKILDLLAAGLSNAEIGQRLSLAAKTVANQVSSIFAKLQVAGRAQAIIKARDAGLGQP
jgi:DNA-binding NarL/FixJ family response regulator